MEILLLIFFRLLLARFSCYSTILLFNYSAILLFCYSTILLFNYSAILLYCFSTILLFYYFYHFTISTILLFYYSVASSCFSSIHEFAVVVTCYNEAIVLDIFGELRQMGACFEVGAAHFKLDYWISKCA